MDGLRLELAPHMEVISSLCAAHGLQHDSGVDFGGGENFLKSEQQGHKHGQGQGPGQVQGSQSESEEASGPSRGQSATTAGAKPKLDIASVTDRRVAASPLVMSPAPRNDEDDEADAWDEVTRTLKPVGDTLRGDRLRTPLGASELPSNVIHILHIARRRSSADQSFSSRTTASKASAVTECLRIVANLCIDHPDNRTRFLHVGGVQAVIATLDDLLSSTIPDDPLALQCTPTALKLLRTSAGALLNLALEHSGVREALRSEHHLSTLAKLASWPRLYVPGAWAQQDVGFPRAALGSTREEEDMQRIRDAASTSGWGWRVLCDVCADEEDAADEKAEGREAETQLREESDANANANADADADEDGDEDGQAEAQHPLELLCRGEGFAALFRPLVAMLAGQDQSKDSSNALPWTDDDVSDLISSDSDILTLAAELLETAGRRSSTFRSRSMQPMQLDAHSTRLLPTTPTLPTPLALLMRFLDVSTAPPSWEGQGVPAASDGEALDEAKKAYSLAKASVARAIVAISGDDENMDKLFAGGMDDERKEGWFLTSCADWMGRSKREDLAGTALLALGNLARKDANCIALAKHPALLSTLASHLQAPDPDVKVIYGCVGLLKNLSIPLPNKSLLGEAGLLELASPFLHVKYDNVQPLQFATVGLLKHLCAGGQIRNVLKLVFAAGTAADKEATPLRMLLQLLGRTQDVPTRMEGTRILVNAIRSLWQSQALPEAALDARRAQARQLLLAEDAVVHALSEMVRGSPKYPVLVNEGIFALTLLSTEPVGALAVAKALLRIAAVPSRQASDQSMDASATALAEASTGEASGSAPRTDGFGNNRASSSSEAHSHPNPHPQSQSPSAAPPLRKDTSEVYGKKSSSTSARSGSGSSASSSPSRSIDMLYSVLARRDARMPPAFAGNACSLVVALAEHAAHLRPADADTDAGADAHADTSALSGTPNEPTVPEQQDLFAKLSSELLPALKHLNEQGPSEVMPQAAATLRALQRARAES